MRIAALVIPLVASLSAACGEAPPAIPPALWETKGLEAPESALPDAAARVVYVSNVNGTPTDKDGNGYISKVGFDGKVIEQKWATGMDAPKGLALAQGKLYASDIDKLAEIDPASGKVVNKYEAPGAGFLNDVAADAAGNVYVSDMATNTIWRLSGGKFEVWLKSDALEHPNGLLVEGDKLIVASWGPMTDMTTIAGRLLAVSLADKSVKPVGSGKPVGHLDGIEPLSATSYIVTDWVAGKVFEIARSGEARALMTLTQGTADLAFDPATRIAYIPRMKDGLLAAYKIE